MLGRHFAGSVAAIAIVASVPAPAWAQTQTYAFDIPAQDLGEAVRKFARISRQQVSFDGGLVRGKRSNPIKGSFTAEVGLAQLLEGTGVGFVRAERGVLVLRQVAEGNGPSASDAVANQTQGVAEILVIGRRSQNTDIRRSENDPQPYVVYSEQEIEQSQASSVEDFLKTRLPMNATKFSPINSPGSSLGNSTQINLRGLGTNQTLILVNGRRMPSLSGITFSNDLEQPDINGIPLSAIERIEVLPSTASGIYGGGATGGVINVILKSSYHGLELHGSYERPFEGDAPVRRIEAAGGLTLEGGKTNIFLSASYSDAEQLLTGDRNFAEKGRALLLANHPASFFDSFFPPVGFLPNIRSLDGSNLVLDNGAPLNSPITFVPEGYQGTAVDGGQALLANAGQYDLRLPNDLTGSRLAITSAPTVISFNGNVRRKFGNSVEAFAEFSRLSNKSVSLAGFSTQNVFLPAGQANNPFTTDIIVTFPNPGLSSEVEIESDTTRAIGGVIVQLPRRWAGQAEVGWSKSSLEGKRTSPLLTFAGEAALSDGTLDVVRDLNQFPLEYGPYLEPSPNVIDGPAVTILKTASARVGGPIFSLPGGSTTLNMLFERRVETAKDAFTDYEGFDFTAFFPERSQAVWSGYAELNFPVFGPQNSVAGIRTLELQMSVRHDRYKTAGVDVNSLILASRDDPLPDVEREHVETSSVDYTAGIKYSPFEGLILRGSLGTGFLPPSIAQIVPTEFTTFSFVRDPKRGNIAGLIGPYHVTSGGNLDLAPEESKSLSLGAILTPAFVPGLRASVDYTRIKKSGEIVGLDYQEIIDFEDLFPERIERAPLEANAPPGFTAGPIISLDKSLLNLARTKVEAFDFQLNYRRSLGTMGELEFYSVATLQTRFAREILPESGFVDSVGYRNGPLRWRGNAGLVWRRNQLTAGWNTQFYGKQKVYSTFNSPGTIELLTQQQGSKTFPTQWYHDVFAKYAFDRESAIKALSGLEVMVGIRNVFNSSPPIETTTEGTGGFSRFGDPRLRRFLVSIRKTFE